jgi:hypothetical protein
MISQSHQCQTNDVSEDWIDSIEHLIRWIAPRTVGRVRLLQRLADVKKARRETNRLHDALCLLSRELDTLTRRRRHQSGETTCSRYGVELGADGLTAVAFDDGASLAGKESIDSRVTVSIGGCRTLRRRDQRVAASCGLARPAAAAPISPTPLTIHQIPRHDRRVAPYDNRPAPASDTSHGPTRSSTVRPCQPRRSHALDAARWAGKFGASSKSMLLSSACQWCPATEAYTAPEWLTVEDLMSLVTRACGFDRTSRFLKRIRHR